MGGSVGKGNTDVGQRTHSPRPDGGEQNRQGHRLQRHGVFEDKREYPMRGGQVPTWFSRHESEGGIGGCKAQGTHRMPPSEDGQNPGAHMIGIVGGGVIGGATGDFV